MKVHVKRNSTRPKFEPIELKLTFVTKEEIDTFFDMFNYIPICDYTRKFSKVDMPRIIRNAIYAVYKPNKQDITRMDNFLSSYFGSRGKA